MSQPTRPSLDASARPVAGPRPPGWTVHVEIQLAGSPPDEVTEAAAQALVAELQPWSASAFGGRGMVTLLASQPGPEQPVASDPPAEARAVDAALQVVSRFAPVRRIHPVL